MKMNTLQDYIDRLNQLNFKEMYQNDFFPDLEKLTTNWRLYGW